MLNFCTRHITHNCKIWPFFLRQWTNSKNIYNLGLGIFRKFYLPRVSPHPTPQLAKYNMQCIHASVCRIYKIRVLQLIFKYLLKVLELHSKELWGKLSTDFTNFNLTLENSFNSFTPNVSTSGYMLYRVNYIREQMVKKYFKIKNKRRQ